MARNNLVLMGMMMMIMMMMAGVVVVEGQNFKITNPVQQSQASSSTAGSCGPLTDAEVKTVTPVEFPAYVANNIRWTSAGPQRAGTYTLSYALMGQSTFLSIPGTVNVVAGTQPVSYSISATVSPAEILSARARLRVSFLPSDQSSPEYSCTVVRFTTKQISADLGSKKEITLDNSGWVDIILPPSNTYGTVEFEAIAAVQGGQQMLEAVVTETGNNDNAPKDSFDHLGVGERVSGQRSPCSKGYSKGYHLLVRDASGSANNQYPKKFSFLAINQAADLDTTGKIEQFEVVGGSPTNGGVFVFARVQPGTAVSTFTLSINIQNGNKGAGLQGVYVSKDGGCGLNKFLDASLKNDNATDYAMEYRILDDKQKQTITFSDFYTFKNMTWMVGIQSKEGGSEPTKFSIGVRVDTSNPAVGLMIGVVVSIMLCGGFCFRNRLSDACGKLFGNQKVQQFLGDEFLQDEEYNTGTAYRPLLDDGGVSGAKSSNNPF